MTNVADVIQEHLESAVKEACAALEFRSSLEAEELSKIESLTRFIIEAAMINIVENCENLSIPPERGIVAFIESVAAWNRKIDNETVKRRHAGPN